MSKRWHAFLTLLIAVWVKDSDAALSAWERFLPTPEESTKKPMGFRGGE